MPDEKFPLGTVGSWFQILEHAEAIPQSDFAQVIKPDPRRWALAFSLRSGASAFITSNPGLGFSAGIQIASATNSPFFYFTQLGGWIQQALWAGSPSPAATLNIVEVIYQPPDSLAGHL